MYSLSWFRTFAATVPDTSTSADVDAVVRFAPPAQYPRLLDVGCGTGRTAAPLAALGYDVTGVDESVDALRVARRLAPTGRFVALDQRHAGDLRATFDVAIVLWNSIGFGSRDDDRRTLAGIAAVLRPGGRLLLDLYHPDWLAANPQSSARDERGAIIDRWLRDGRSHHRIRYADGSVDEISFNVYGPAEIDLGLRAAGLLPEAYLVRWMDRQPPAAAVARYQVVSRR